MNRERLKNFRPSFVKNPNATGAVLIMALLSLSTLAGINYQVPLGIEPQQAFAQTATNGSLTQYVTVSYTDGSTQELKDVKNFSPADLAAINGKILSQLRIRLVATLPLQSDSISSSGASMSVKVLKPDGTYATISFSPAISDYNIAKTGLSEYTLYQATIPASAIQSAIGSAPSNFASEIRVTSGVNSAIYGVINGGAPRGFYTTQTVSVMSILVNPGSVQPTGGDDTGGTGGITPTPTDSPPHGAIYTVVSIFFTDGTAVEGMTGDNGQFNGVNIPQKFPFSITVGTQNKSLKSVSYAYIVHLDNDQYVLSDRLSFADNGSTGNFAALVDNQNINKSYTNIVSRYGPSYSNGGGDYKLITMDVSAADIENAVKLTGNSTIQNGQQFFQYGFGTLTFHARASTLSMTYGGKTYTVNLPETTTNLDIQRGVITSINGGCTLDAGQCNPQNNGGSTANPLAFMNNPMALFGIAMVGGGATVGVLIYKHRR